ncbi:hypothetical protein ACJIZ3_008657 [Penstemon smallii]|uniref:Ycf20-like protein n=1 Tax=Penstemon smallii TaxID=265156 RepID=A0ABD3TBC9_9LAMI
MACRMDVMMLQSFSVMENERSEKSCVFLRHSHSIQECITHNSYRKRSGWKIAFALNTDQGNLNGDNSALGGTRLGRIVGAGGRELLSKLNSARKNFPMKVFLLLLGFYTANALATILGQTGDWDVLVAGVVVAAIEGIGALMYKRPVSSRRLQSLVVMINYWKAGVCLGLFVDAFKLGS